MIDKQLCDPKSGVFTWLNPSEVFVVSPTIKKDHTTGKNYIKDSSYKGLYDKLMKDKNFDPEINLIGKNNFNNVEKII